MGMEIPMGIPIPMGIRFFLWGSPDGDPRVAVGMGIHMGIPTKILWEWDGNGVRNSTPTATLLVRVLRYYVLFIPSPRGTCYPSSTVLV